MNLKVKGFLKKISASILAQIVSLGITIIMTFFMPKLISQTQFGYWQLYVFYASYVGIMHFGLIDGIYLRFGGKDYNEIDHKQIRSQFWQLSFFEFIVAVSIIFLAIFAVGDVVYKKIYIFVAVFLFFKICQTFFIYMLQMSMRIKQYAIVLIVDRLTYIAVIFIFILSGYKNFEVLVLAEIFALAVSLCLGAIFNKKLVLGKLLPPVATLKESFINISIGIKLMIANFSGMLILGIARLLIEKEWSIEIFAQISLTLTISNIVMAFTGAISLVLFPTFRRVQQDKLGDIYSYLRPLVTTLFISVLILYFPLKILFVNWLPSYSEGLQYMAILFPMCVYESKMTLLINTYLKTLRKEWLILLINVCAVAFGAILFFTNTYIFASLDGMIFSILLVMVVRCVFAELLLSKLLKKNFVFDTVLEFFVIGIFVATNWFLSVWLAAIVTALSIAIYILVKRKSIVCGIRGLKDSLSAAAHTKAIEPNEDNR